MNVDIRHEKMKRWFVSLLALACLPVSLLATDISITPANVVPSAAAHRVEATAGATITAGQLIYLDSTDTDTSGKGKAKLSDANGSAALRVVDGIAINGASAGQPLVYVTFDPALTIGGSQTVNTILVLSGTAGGLAPAADLASGWYVTVLGVVKTSTTLYFRAPGLISGAAVTP